MTIDALAHRGVHVERPAPGEWIVPAGADRAARTSRSSPTSPTPRRSSPPRWSPAAPSRSTGWPAHTTQVGRDARPSSCRSWARRSSARGGALTVDGGAGPRRHPRASTSTSRRPASSPRRSSRSRRSPTRPSTHHRHRPHPRPRDRPPRGARRRAATRSAARRHRARGRHRASSPRPLHGGPWRATTTTGWRRPAPSSGSRVAGRRDRRHRHDREDPAAVPRALAADARRTDGDADAAAAGCHAGIVSWLERRRRRRRAGEFDESDVAGAPESEGQPPAHEDAAPSTPTPSSAACSRVDRGRYTVLVDEDGPDERRCYGDPRPRAAQACRSSPATGSRRRRHAAATRARLARIVGIQERTHAAAPQRRRHRRGRADHRRQRRPDAHRGRGRRPRAARRGSSTATWSPR